MMMRDIGNSVAAELVKLRGLPSVLAAVLGTVAVAVTLAAASPDVADPVQLTLRTVPFLQIGPIVIGVLAGGTEYAGRQIRMTLVATPNRPVLLAGKGIAVLAAVAIAGFAAVGAALGAAWLSLAVRDVPPGPVVNGWPVVGAVLYLVLIGILGFVMTLLLRSLILPLVMMLCLVLVVPPLLGGFTEHVRYLPDRAGSLLYLPDADPVLTPVTGALVLLIWIAVVAVAALTTFLRHDA